MNLVTIHLDAIQVGKPLPFTLRDASGVLLAHKGFVVNSRHELDAVTGQRQKLFIDVTESEAYHRAYVNKINSALSADQSLGEIVTTQLSSSELEKKDKAEELVPDWLDLQEQTHTMLRDTNTETFLPRLKRLQALLNRHTRLNPDGTLFALIHLSSSELQRYSATHAMLVSVMCMLAAREVLHWSEEDELSLSCAALTMNIAMSNLQDKLAVQRDALNPAQKQLIDRHAVQGAALLEQLGVTDKHWLVAVLGHHTKTPGTLSSRTEGLRMGRLIQRADMFAARLAPRASRSPAPPGMAMQACYFDENKQIDEAGAALIKAVGIYSPGSFVKLITQEVAIVIRRGTNTTTPRVAVLVNRNGMPTTELIVRDTAHPQYKIATSVAHRDVKVGINLDRLLMLTKTAAADRLW